MSSAVLYLAIVAIWACVLIPRWLRRDSARGAPASAEEPPVLDYPDDELAEEAADEPADDDADIAGGAGGAGDGQRPVPAAVRSAEPLSAEESRHRMLAARRRLLLMLTGLEIAAIALAVLGLAAMWVVVPPTVMLAGYLLLLREAAQADAERAQYEADALAAAWERERYAQARRVTPADGTLTTDIPEAAATLAGKFAAAPVPADYEDSAPGRDFAPGLAGKYTTSNAGAEGADEDYYEGYEAPPLRAVGD
jgi:hypothetical protein